MTFTVASAPTGAATIPPDADLPVLGPVRFDYGPSREQVAALAAAALALIAGVAMLARRRSFDPTPSTS
jgi:hypothetical protein